MSISTRKAYGQALVELGKNNPNIVVLDAETSNSTFADGFKKEFPDRFVESFIAEQNMVSMALGLSKMGKVPFVSTFTAFFTRAFDQIRMSQYSDGNIKFIGSHCGVSIGEDGASQMGLEDIAMFRSVLNSTVLYPSDSVATKFLVNEMANHFGLDYLRITRGDTPVIYDENEVFPIGGSKTLRSSNQDKFTIIGAGITLHEALKAYNILQEKNVFVRVIDLYSVKPLDIEVLKKACDETDGIIVVEDHYPFGGIYEAICGSRVITKPVYGLNVKNIPHSGKPAELLQFEEIDSEAIVKLVLGLGKE